MRWPASLAPSRDRDRGRGDRRGSGCAAATAAVRPKPPRAAASSAGGPAAGSLDPLAELVGAAQDEGTLTTIGLSPTSCNYDELIKRLHREVRDQGRRAPTGRRP